MNGNAKTRAMLWLYTRWIHCETRYVVIIIGECRLEATNMPAFLYVRWDDPEGMPWALHKGEFLDGRFERTR